MGGLAFEPTPKKGGTLKGHTHTQTRRRENPLAGLLTFSMARSRGKQHLGYLGHERGQSYISLGHGKTRESPGFCREIDIV